MNEIKVSEEALGAILDVARAGGMFFSAYYLGSEPRKVIVRSPFPEEQTWEFALETGEKKELAPGESPV